MIDTTRAIPDQAKPNLHTLQLLGGELWQIYQDHLGHPQAVAIFQLAGQSSSGNLTNQTHPVADWELGRSSA